ncbi:hypothetical protein DACRYDRAFT_116412 [Dacryopinax primogenitus]|uniref:Anaphase-promoting complex subunit 4 n=1 Tax=Dacryopinax primogenitus (strain DJM 731) TaxID=1858805 RepID=M5G829_DACPD|nr:uncharacterized protein DACRYDRAFT_116412 [Dacryopinax primogenitus]EJU02027.1 hypothetical protein DACRYDRAFT_116412 [Dacryopinax primogenitus]
MSVPSPALRTFTSLSSFSLSSKARLPKNAFCPTKDLLVLVSEHEGTDRVSLWKATGSKVWDLSLGKQDRFTELAWSPDGNLLMVAREPARLTLHSVHDGHEITSLVVPFDQTPDPTGKGKRPERSTPSKLKNVWWLEKEEYGQDEGSPLRRRSVPKKEDPVLGSAQNLLRTMPYLTPVKEIKADSIFSLSKDKTASQDSSLPPHLLAFPSLLVDPLDASIQPQRTQDTPSSRLKDDEAIRSGANDGSVLVVSDENGALHFFLNGTYPLGYFNLGADCEPCNIHLMSESMVMVSFRRGRGSSDEEPPYVGAASLSLPLLPTRALRTTAAISSLLREILVIMQQAVDEMAKAWMGAEGLEGAKDLGVRWYQTLEKKGEGKTNAMFELVTLLCTGRPRPSMVEFLGLLTERAWESWNSTVQNAFKLMERNIAERIVPACERCVVLLEELKGWCTWEESYADFGVPKAEVEDCISAVLRMLELSHALATHILEERWSFDGLMIWLQAQRLSIQEGQAQPEHPMHDPLQVAEYLQTGLLRSGVDEWFIGPAPTTTPTEQAASATNKTLDSALSEARQALKQPRERVYRMHRSPVGSGANEMADLGAKPVTDADYPPSRTLAERVVLSMDRNIVALGSEVGQMCQHICVKAAGAAGRTADVVQHWATARADDLVSAETYYKEFWVTGLDETRVQYVALRIVDAHQGPEDGSGYNPSLCVLKLEYDRGSGAPIRSSAALLDIQLSELDQESQKASGDPTIQKGCLWDLLDYEFFDEVNLVLIVRRRRCEKETIPRQLDPDLDTLEDREAMIKNLKDEKTGMARESQGLRDENTRLQGKIEVFQATMKENDKLVKMLEKQLQAAQTQQQQQAHAQQQSSQSLGFEYGGLYAAPTGILYANQAPNSSFSGMPSLTMPIHNMSADFASNANGPSPPRGPHHISASTFGTPTTGMRITTIAPSVAEQAQASQSFHAYTDNGSRFEVNNHASGSAGISSDSASSEANGGTGMTNSPIEAAATVQTMPPGTDGISSQSTGANQYSFPTAQQHHQQAQNQGMSYPSSDYPYAHSTYSQPSQRLQSEHQQDIKPPTPAQPFRSAQAINSLNNMNLDPAMSETVALLKAQAFGKARRRRNLSGYDESSTTSATALDIRKRPRFEDDDV